MLVSVVIPVRNAERYLERCLEQVKEQNYLHQDIELIVVDGASEDRTLAIANAFKPGKISYRVLALVEKGRSQGLNAGINAARGAAICRLDVRTRIGPDYIGKCAAALLTSGAANVGGLQVPEGETLTQQAIGAAMAHRFGVGNAQFRLGKQSGFVDTVYLGFFRKEIFDRVGLFDESANVISEDSDMNQRIREAGEKVYLDVDIRCYYVPRETLSKHFTLYYRYGGARAANVIKHRGFTSVRQIVAPGLLAVLVIGAIASPFSQAMRDGTLLIVIIYLLADISVSISVALKRQRPRLVPPLIAAFPAMHFGWALGFWRKLIFGDPRGAQWKG